MNNKLLRTIALILCLSCALVSCEISDGDTSKDINVEASTPSENSVIDITSEDASIEKSSDISIETSEEVSEPVEESSEEVSDPEPDYVKKMDDEMADLYLSKFYLRSFLYPHTTDDEYYLESHEHIKKMYHAYGNLNGYTLFSTLYLEPFADFSKGTFRADGYLFESSTASIFSLVCLYLYRDNVIMTFEDAYDKGLFDAKDAYDLINSNPAPANNIMHLEICAKKIEEVSELEPDYVKVMDDEMTDLFMRQMYHCDIPESQNDCTPKEYEMYLCEKQVIEISYHGFGNLNGYTLFITRGLDASDFQNGRFAAGDYMFESTDISRASKICTYLYRDNEFITFEDAYEQGLFDPKDAYELINNNPAPENQIGIIQLFAEKIQTDYVTTMDDEMADLFLSSMGDFPMPDETSTVLYNWYFTQRDTIQQTYHAYGNLNGYTLFMVNDAGLHDLAIAVYRAGDYVFKANCHGYPSLVFLYLYRDNEFITFEDSYEQGLFDPKDAYKLINNNPPPKYCRFAKPSAEKVED